MRRLVHGVHGFKKKHFAANRELYERLAQQGQHPEALFIACCDSRVDTSRLVEASPGDIFVVRNIGNRVPPYAEGMLGISAGAAIEYAVLVLGVSDIIVCGHSECGAMNALLGPPEALASLALTRRWLAYGAATREIVDALYGDVSGSARALAGAGENVLVQLEHLRTYPFVEERLQEGRLHLHGWVYVIRTGDVYRYEPAEEEFVLATRGIEVRAGPSAPLPPLEGL